MLINEPERYKAKLGKLPKNVSPVTKSSGPIGFIQVFVSSKGEFGAQLRRLKPLLKPQGLLWGTYPKETSKAKVDTNRDVIREYAETIGLKVVAQVAMDGK